MVVRIRLARFGRRHQPTYRFTVANHTRKRDGAFLEQLGSYDPAPDVYGVKRVLVNVERAMYWLSVGAQPSDTVRRLFGKVGLLPSLPRGPASQRPLPLEAEEVIRHVPPVQEKQAGRTILPAPRWDNLDASVTNARLQVADQPATFSLVSCAPFGCSFAVNDWSLVEEPIQGLSSESALLS